MWKRYLVRSLSLLLATVTLSTAAFAAIDDCTMREWGKEKGDCYCGANPTEVKRSLLKVGTTNILAVTYQTTAVTSYPGHDFGCWFLTDVKPPSGYKVYAVQFTTVTDGHCQLSDEINIHAKEIKDFIVKKQPTREMLSQDYQECELFTRADQEVLFKYRFKGYLDKDHLWSLKAGGNLPSPGWEINMTENERKGRRYGYGQPVLFFVPVSTKP